MMVFGPLMMFFGVVVVLLGVLMALRFVAGGIGGEAVRPSCGARSQRGNLLAPTDQRDPLKIVRERYAQGEIDHDELEHYLDNLLVEGQPRRSAGDPSAVNDLPPLARGAKRRSC